MRVANPVRTLPGPLPDIEAWYCRTDVHTDIQRSKLQHQQVGSGLLSWLPYDVIPFKGGVGRSNFQTPAMDAARNRALRRYNPELRTEIIVNNLLPDLHRDAGGFLTDVESLTVSSKRCNVGQVDELITILLTKENADFDSFCHILKKGDYGHWSEVLSQSAASAKRGMTTSIGLAKCVGVGVGVCEKNKVTLRMGLLLKTPPTH